jgi:hypothetical protein
MLGNLSGWLYTITQLVTLLQYRCSIHHFLGPIGPFAHLLPPAGTLDLPARIKTTTWETIR